MSSSLSCLVCPTSYYGRSPSVLVRKRALSLSLRAHAAAREEASDAETPKSTEADSDPSSRGSAVKGFGPRPSPPPPKPSKSSVFSSPSKDKKSVTTRRPAPNRPVGGRTPDPVVREQDNVFIVGLTFIGVLIFFEGIAVAGSGLLPDEWDTFVVKYVYPAFTPTVGLFLVGAVLYGVFKIRQPIDDLDKPN